jgi:hypothetical protein
LAMTRLANSTAVMDILHFVVLFEFPSAPPSWFVLKLEPNLSLIEL